MLRKRLLPKTVGDYASSIFIFVLIPIIYWFELFVVFPLYFENRDTAYILHCIFSTYLLISVVGNYVAVFLIDTSIEGKFLSSQMKPKWKFCEVCECITPPRSWHCNTCNVCILKRDHHCNFTACCVGHYNQRYFMLFLIYFTFGALYCTYFNVYYLWMFTPLSFFGLLKICLPLAFLMFGHDVFLMQFYRMLCVLSVVALVAGGTILYFHLYNICHGMVMYENSKNIRDYDLGSIKQNLRQVFGKRWYLTWVTPFFESELPNDGIHWDEIKLLTNKSK